MVNQTAMLFSNRYVQKASDVLLRPGCQYGWDEIVKGAEVRRQNGNTKRMVAVDRNTFRGFHRVNKGVPGASEAFQEYVTEQRQNLVDQLVGVSDRDGLQRVSNGICIGIRRCLSNIRADQLMSYNKVRKPVDLYLEHLIAMSFELKHCRQVLVPLLFLPLDCQILGSRELFTDNELAIHGLRRTSTYSDVTTEETYLSLQEIVSRKANEVSKALAQPFWPIYFDMIWNDRHSNWGSNLFETNP